jgi:4-amino-4-deoxy-L-arabinose transferase-like glycosyltransferase
MRTSRIAQPGAASLLFAVALSLRLGYVLAYPQLQLQADSLDYDRLARSVSMGRGLRDADGEPESGRAPLYPLFVASIYRLADANPSRVRVVQAVLGSFVPLLVLQLGLSCFAPRVAWAAALASAGYPAFIAYTGLLLTETCATLVVTGAAFCTVLAAQSRGFAWYALIGFGLGLATLCRAELVALAGATILSMLVIPGSSLRGRLSRAAVVGAVFALTLLPWTLRNYQALGAFIPLTTDGWRTLWIASYPERWLEWKAEEPLLSIEKGASDPLERSRRFRAAALDNLRTHPGAYAWMVLRRIPLLLIGGHSNVIAGLEGTTAESAGLVRMLKLGLLTINTLVLGAAGAGLWLCRRRWAALWPLYVTVLVPPIVYLLLFAVPRYLIPTMPVAFLFAADAVLRLPPSRVAAPKPTR